MGSHSTKLLSAFTTTIMHWSPLLDASGKCPAWFEYINFFMSYTCICISCCLTPGVGKSESAVFLLVFKLGKMCCLRPFICPLTVSSDSVESVRSDHILIALIQKGLVGNPFQLMAVHKHYGLPAVGWTISNMLVLLCCRPAVWDGHITNHFFCLSTHGAVSPWIIECWHHLGHVWRHHDCHNGRW